jgi:hypothetical protein
VESSNASNASQGESSGDSRNEMPNLFILGAPKCASSAVYFYLGQHPDIFMAQKEIHYFGKDLVFKNKGRISRQVFLEQYDAVDEECYRGDSAIWYLYSETAASEIHAASPGARCIVLLRNPVDVVYALHSEFLYQGNEDLADFAAALEAEGDRRLGKRIPSSCNTPWALQYTRVARFGEQLARYRAIFDPGQIHIVMYDDLAADASRVYRDVLRFLGIDETFQPDFAVVNPNSVIRSRALRQFLRHPPKPVRALARQALKRQTTRSAVGRRLVELNTVRVPRPPLDPTIRHMLQREFSSDIELLADQLGRDLSPWLAGRDLAP